MHMNALDFGNLYIFKLFFQDLIASSSLQGLLKRILKNFTGSFQAGKLIIYPFENQYLKKKKEKKKVKKPAQCPVLPL